MSGIITLITPIWCGTGTFPNWAKINCWCITNVLVQKTDWAKIFHTGLLNVTATAQHRIRLSGENSAVSKSSDVGGRGRSMSGDRIIMDILS